MATRRGEAYGRAWAGAVDTNPAGYPLRCDPGVPPPRMGRIQHSGSRSHFFHCLLGIGLLSTFLKYAPDIIKPPDCVSGLRSWLAGSCCGTLSSLKAHTLGSIVIKEALARARVQPEEVSEVILGQVLTAGQGQNPARQAAIMAGIPYTIPAYLVNMLCGSGLKAVQLGCQAIKSRESEVVVCGGQESMSQAHHSMHLRSGVKLGDALFTDTITVDGLTDAFNNIHMGETAENIAKQFNISREEQDRYALESQARTKRAQDESRFAKEMIPVTTKVRKETAVVDRDEFPRPNSTLEDLGKLRPAFLKNGGTVTAGNASGINDGAAALVLMTEGAARSRGLAPLARIVSSAQVGVDPTIMGTGPIPAVTAALQRAGWDKDDVDLFELNEAFAAQALAVVRGLGVNPAKVNVNGGAISLGHPIGASGARILVTLLYALERTGGRKGVASLCVGGGMGIALCVERV
ncbi:acetyl-CoA acetyltransferase, cytosolic [Bacillus rossius redtenbacheri]|uniref:acetyl-CoA acetyltransferase, cytosolic n=1 Tax=Bacillus rossius redtenbacheri TaxID=93214 RepID=UPI002FDEEBCA